MESGEKFYKSRKREIRLEQMFGAKIFYEQGASSVAKKFLLFASAYASPDNSKIVAVFVNMKHSFEEVSVNLPPPQSTSIYIPDERHDLAKIHSDKIKLFPRSVTTVVFHMK